MKKLLIILFCFSMLLFATQDADAVDASRVLQNTGDRALLDSEKLEEAGTSEDLVAPTAGPQQRIRLNRLGQVLLIPESLADVVGMYDPYDGTYLGNLIINNPPLMLTPINAVQGPDNNIYLSDQLSDAVFVYDTAGTYLYTYADASDGLNNVRGFDFRDGHLFITHGTTPYYVLEFSGPHTFERYFITGFSPFDILFLDDGRALVTDITNDRVSLHDTNGTFISQVVYSDFPEQVQFDDVLPGAFLNASFSDNVIIDFELNGTVVSTLPYTNGPRGIYRLGNGNLLATNGDGIHELDATTGAIIQTENTGSGRFIELYSVSAGQLYFWDFETGEQGWTHTNGGTFPAAWDVVSSSYNCGGSYTIAPPDAGDSSFCIDGDAGGICHDTAMSPVVDNPGFAWFKWGTHFQQYASYQTFTVIMRTFSSGIWNPWTAVWTYTADTSPRYDSVDISAVTADSVQVGFVYDQPNATYAWFAAFDNVELVVPPSHDVGCYSVVSPPEGPMASGNYDVIGWIRNVGGAAETFDVVAHVYDTVGMSLIFDQTINLTLDAGADTNLNFGSFGFDPDMYFYTEIYTMLSGDVNPSNDTSSGYSNTIYDIIWDFETGWQGWTHTNGQSFPYAWSVLASSYIYPNWTPPAAGDSCMWIDSDSAGIGPVVEDSAWSPAVATPPNMETLRYGLGYNNLGSTSDSLYVGIRTHTAGVWNPPTQLKRYSADYGPDWDSLDISAYSTADSIQIYFYYSGSYDWYAAFDNVMIKGIGTGIAEEPTIQNISTFGFAAAMPTITEGKAQISYVTTVAGRVSLKIYDRIGRLVQTLVDEHQTAGERSVIWNGMDTNNRSVANGVYFFKLEAENQTAIQKIILLK